MQSFSENPERERLTGEAVDKARVASIVGHQGEQSEAVYKIAIGRDDLKLKEMGASIKFANGSEYVGSIFRQRCECRSCWGRGHAIA